MYVSVHCTTASADAQTTSEQLFDIHQLEARALLHALGALATGTTGCRLDWYTDNEICHFVVLKGISQTRDATMQQVSRLVLWFQLLNNVKIAVHRVSSEGNYAADSRSPRENGSVSTPGGVQVELAGVYSHGTVTGGTTTTGVDSGCEGNR